MLLDILSHVQTRKPGKLVNPPRNTLVQLLGLFLHACCELVVVTAKPQLQDEAPTAGRAGLYLMGPLRLLRPLEKTHHPNIQDSGTGKLQDSPKFRLQTDLQSTELQLCGRFGVRASLGR